MSRLQSLSGKGCWLSPYQGRCRDGKHLVNCSADLSSVFTAILDSATCGKSSFHK